MCDRCVNPVTIGNAGLTPGVTLADGATRTGKQLGTSTRPPGEPKR